MAKDKRAQRARQREKREQSLQKLRARALAVLETLSIMPGLQLENIRIQKAILAAPDYNYYEKLMLYHIHKAARKALRLYNNPTKMNATDLEEIRKMSTGMKENHAWLINTYESIVISKDTGYSDMLSEVLLTLHSASDITKDYGPVWLEFTHTDEEGEVTALAEAAKQLEECGLVIRRKRMFAAQSWRRWPELEMQMVLDQEEAALVEEGEALGDITDTPTAVTVAPWQQQELDSSFHEAALADATCYADPDLIFPFLAQAGQPAGGRHSGAGSEGVGTGRQEEQRPPSDVYTAMAQDLAEYEQEIRERGQQGGRQATVPSLIGTQQQRAEGSGAAASDDQQQSAAGGRGRGRGKGKGRGRGRGRGGQQSGQQQQQGASEHWPHLPSQQHGEHGEHGAPPPPPPPRQQQQQHQRQQQEPEHSKPGAGPPPGWTPQFAATTAPARAPSPAFEPALRNEDFLADDALLPSFEDLAPVLLKEEVISAAIHVRVQLESIFKPHIPGDHDPDEVSRTGGSTFLSYVRTNVHASVYEKVVVARLWRTLSPLVHAHGVPDAPGSPADDSYQATLRGLMAKVEYAREWLEQHLAHLMPNPPAGFTMEDQSSMERLHKTATYVLEALSSKRQLMLSAVVPDMVFSSDMQSCIDGELEDIPGVSRRQRCVTLLQRTVDQLLKDGLVGPHPRGVFAVLNQMKHFELDNAKRYIDSPTTTSS